MKIKALTYLPLIAMLGVSMSAFAANRFSGDIMDSACAAMGSHKQMESMHSKMFKHPDNALTGKEARMCTLVCVKNGAHFVLYNPASKTVYQLEPNTDARPYAGEHVTIEGTKSGNTIHVQKISGHRM